MEQAAGLAPVALISTQMPHSEIFGTLDGAGVSPPDQLIGGCAKSSF